MRALPDNNLNYPVLITTTSGSGSGFYFRKNQRLFLVTVLHVLYNDDGSLIEKNVQLISYESGKPAKAVKLNVDLTATNIRKKEAKDIVLVELASINQPDSSKTFTTELAEGVQFVGVKGAGITTVPFHGLKKLDDVLVSNDVFILGYPNSIGMPGSQQIENDKPLLRKGIIAGINTSNETIILDCPVYFGNSGGLAIEVEVVAGKHLFRVIGVVSQYIPFVDRLKSLKLGYVNTSIENSGYSVAVPMDTIFELTNEKPVVSSK